MTHRVIVKCKANKSPEGSVKILDDFRYEIVPKQRNSQWKEK